MIAPHGGTLVRRIAEGVERERWFMRIPDMPQVRVDGWARADLEMIATGAYSPLVGFMGRSRYRTVLEDLRLETGIPWTLPVVLRVDAETAARLRPGRDLALRDPDEGRVIAILHLQEIFTHDKGHEARRVYGTDDPAHPGVARLFAQGDVMLGGPITAVDLAPPPEEIRRFHLEPRDTRLLFELRGWKRVAAFQARNPVHRAHEHLQKCALEICDGLLLHPLAGTTKADELPVDLRMASYRALVENYYPKDRVALSVFPANMHYAGPREAIHHAICRRNYGCTHFIVGRDHAGVGSYYGTYDAQRIFDRFGREELGIEPLCFENAFYCKRCGGMATCKTCGHGKDERIAFSGTMVRSMLTDGTPPPPAVTRPEVAAVLTESARRRAGVAG